MSATTGSFVWHELHTNDRTKALKFYAALMAWETKDVQMGPGEPYGLCFVNGKDHAGITKSMAPAHVPPHWLPYVAVDDVDVSVAKVQELGGRLLMPAMDIPDVGRFAPVTDPQGAAFALYKDYGINPVGGCWPAMIQMPVFFSLYFMLQNAVELRGQSFLWIKDLTQPDTIFSMPLPIDFFGISHLTINPLPVMVTALMAVMMRMTPQMSDPQQQKIAQFMPLFFLFLFYNFAAALSLYYVINNSVAIFQIYRNLKKPLPDLQRKPKPAGR